MVTNPFEPIENFFKTKQEQIKMQPYNTPQIESFPVTQIESFQDFRERTRTERYMKKVLEERRKEIQTWWLSDEEKENFGKQKGVNMSESTTLRKSTPNTQTATSVEEDDLFSAFDQGNTQFGKQKGVNMQKGKLWEPQEEIIENDIFGAYDQGNTQFGKQKSVNMQKGKLWEPSFSQGSAPPQGSAPVRASNMEKLKEKLRQAFKDAQAKYKKILDKSKSLEAEAEKAKQSFLSQAKTDEEKKLISKSKYKEYKKARQEVFNEYRQQVIDATRTGDLANIKTSKEDFSAKIRKKIAEKMYGKGVGELSGAEANAFSYFDSKYQSESYNKAIKVRKEALGKLIDEHYKIKMIKPDDLKSVMAGGRNTGGRNAAKQIEENGFKFGKGKVAMAVMGLAGLAGVTSLMFSGGRQQNSNLYNANQAMY